MTERLEYHHEFISKPPEEAYDSILAWLEIEGEKADKVNAPMLIESSHGVPLSWNIDDRDAKKQLHFTIQAKGHGSVVLLEMISPKDVTRFARDGMFTEWSRLAEEIWAFVEKRKPGSEVSKADIRIKPTLLEQVLGVSTIFICLFTYSVAAIIFYGRGELLFATMALLAGYALMILIVIVLTQRLSSRKYNTKRLRIIDRLRFAVGVSLNLIGILLLWVGGPLIGIGGFLPAMYGMMFLEVSIGSVKQPLGICRRHQSEPWIREND